MAPSIRFSADSGSSIDWWMTCAHPSVMMWLGWFRGLGQGGLWCLARYSSGEGKILEPCGPGQGRRGCRAAVIAAAAAGILVDDWREGRFFFPTWDVVLEMGVEVGLLAWLWSRGLLRVWEAVGTCIEGGGGWALGVVWACVSISESVSPSCLHGACGTFESAAYCPIWAGRTGVGDYVSGFELLRSGELPRSCGLPDVPARFVSTQVFSQRVPWGGAIDIST